MKSMKSMSNQWNIGTELARAVDVMMARAKRIYSSDNRIKRMFSFSGSVFEKKKRIKNIFFVSLSSYRNTREVWENSKELWKHSPAACAE